MNSAVLRRGRAVSQSNVDAFLSQMLYAFGEVNDNEKITEIKLSDPKDGVYWIEYKTEKETKEVKTTADQPAS